MIISCDFHFSALNNVHRHLRCGFTLVFDIAFLSSLSKFNEHWLYTHNAQSHWKCFFLFCASFLTVEWLLKANLCPHHERVNINGFVENLWGVDCLLPLLHFISICMCSFAFSVSLLYLLLAFSVICWYYYNYCFCLYFSAYCTYICTSVQYFFS